VRTGFSGCLPITSVINALFLRMNILINMRRKCQRLEQRKPCSRSRTSESTNFYRLGNFVQVTLGGSTNTLEVNNGHGLEPTQVLIRFTATPSLKI